MTILRSKVNGDLYKLELVTTEPSERIEVRHIESGKLFRWETMATFEHVNLKRNTLKVLERELLIGLGLSPESAGLVMNHVEELRIEIEELKALTNTENDHQR